MHDTLKKKEHFTEATFELMDFAVVIAKSRRIFE